MQFPNCAINCTSDQSRGAAALSGRQHIRYVNLCFPLRVPPDEKYTDVVLRSRNGGLGGRTKRKMMCKLADKVKWKISLRTLLMRAFREPSFFQQATRVGCQQNSQPLETKQATLCKTYRRANASFTTMGRSFSARSQWPCNSC